MQNLCHGALPTPPTDASAPSGPPSPPRAPPPPPPPPPAIDCAGQWGEWSDCSEECAGGTQWRTFTVSTRPANGGEQCEADAYARDSQACNTEACVEEVPLVSPVIEMISTNPMDGWSTMKLKVALGPAAGNVYTIFGEACDGSSTADCQDVPLSVPPAYQCATPFGSHLGGTNPAFWAIANSESQGYSQYDSWLTVGVEDGNSLGQVSSIGIDFDSWTRFQGIRATDGAVFWMDPSGGPTGEEQPDGTRHVVVAQLTLVRGVPVAGLCVACCCTHRPCCALTDRLCGCVCVCALSCRMRRTRRTARRTWGCRARYQAREGQLSPTWCRTGRVVLPSIGDRRSQRRVANCNIFL